MNRLGFIVLSILSQNGATNKLSSMSVQEISDTEEFGYKPNTIFKKIKHWKARSPSAGNTIFFASMAISTGRIFKTPATRNAWQNRNGKVVE